MESSQSTEHRRAKTRADKGKAVDADFEREAQVASAIMAAFEDGTNRVVGLRTPTYRCREYLAVQYHLFNQAGNGNFRIVCLVPTDVEAEVARRLFVDEMGASNRVAEPNHLAETAGAMCFVSYRFFVRAGMAGLQDTVFLAHEHPSPTVDFELAVCRLASMPPAAGRVVVAVWKSAHWLFQYTGPPDQALVVASSEYSAAQIPPAIRYVKEDELRQAIADTGAAKLLVVSFAPRPELIRAIRELPHCTIVQLNANTDARRCSAKISCVYGSRAVFGSRAGFVVLEVDPVAFGEGFQLSSTCRDALFDNLPDVGLVILGAEGSLRMRDPETGMVHLNLHYRFAKHQLAAQYSWVSDSATCVATDSFKTGLRDAPDAEERTAFGADIMAFAMGLVEYYPGIAPRKMPVNAVGADGLIGKACENLVFLGLLRAEGHGYELMDMGRRFSMLSARLPRRPEFSTTMLMARPSPKEPEHVRGLLLRMALACEPVSVFASRGVLRDWRLCLDALDFILEEVVDDEGTPIIKTLVSDPPLRWVDRRWLGGPVAWGPLWMRFCCRDQLRRASGDFAKVPGREKSGRMPFLTLAGSDLVLNIHQAEDTWLEARELEDALSLGHAQQDGAPSDIVTLERHLVWAFSGQLMRVVKGYDGAFSATSLRSGTRVEVAPVMHGFLDFHWDKIRFESKTLEKSLLGIATLMRRSDGKLAMNGFTVVQGIDAVGEMYNSSAESYRFLDTNTVAQVVGPE